MDSLQKFVDAQEYMYADALKEIRNGKKEGHWMWYIFPQIVGLGKSSISFYYAIKSLEEAEAYMQNEILRSHLLEITTELLNQKEDNIIAIFGDVDAQKLLSCMTLFSLVSDEDVFSKVIEKYYYGNKDEKTIQFCKVNRIRKG